MFVDEVILKVIAGKGGDGCTSFRREKCVPLGGPDGANGGKGADIIFEVDPGLKTLLDLRYAKIIKGDKGINGKGSNRTGANAEDIVIKVPQGTTVFDQDTGLVIADLINIDDKAIIAHGGRGGRGNKAFATHNNTAPKLSEYGEPGEERLIKCELRMIADVGLVGMPSVGKSTLLSVISASKPKIAEYHFTTLSPNLGVVKLKDYRSFIVADLPGLIEGASEGTGLGHKFLKHAMRTRVLAHVIDMGSFEGRNPIEDFEIIKNEIDKYSKKLANKKQIVIANKMDLPSAKENLEKFKAKFPELEVFEISAINNIGIEELMNKIADILDSLEDNEMYNDEELESHVIYKFKNEKPYTIRRDNDVWVIEGDEIEKLFKMTKFTEDESVLRFGRKLKGMGIEDELERLGAIRGDEVQILDYLFIFKE
ncbi:MAG: GTPase ObgE [Bacilli bacterium]|nr:GTPase ObgE [Bacilli bacterium]